MPEPTLAVLLRNGNHNSSLTTTVRYALKCNDLAVSYARTPIQIPIAGGSPELIDLGFMRPSLTLTGVVDTIGGDTSNTTAGYAGMEYFAYTRDTVSKRSGSDVEEFGYEDGGGSSQQVYYIPYKNALEEAVGTWIYLHGETPLQIEIGDAKFPVGHGGYVKGGTGTSRYHTAGSNDATHSTGGAIYECAIQQGRFALQAAREDRYDFTLQFVVKRRLDIP